MNRLVVQVSNLAEFTADVPPGIVRLNLSTRSVNSRPSRDVNLDLFGVNDLGEIVWLHESVSVLWVEDEPAPGRDVQVYEGMGRAKTLVKAHLETLTYQVRGGRYAVPNDVIPLRGEFECVQWVEDEEEGFHPVEIEAVQ